MSRALGQFGTCRECSGSGETLRLVPGTIARERVPCPECKGDGWDPSNVPPETGRGP